MAPDNLKNIDPNAIPFLLGAVNKGKDYVIDNKIGVVFICGMIFSFGMNYTKLQTLEDIATRDSIRISKLEERVAEQTTSIKLLQQQINNVEIDISKLEKGFNKMDEHIARLIP